MTITAKIIADSISDHAPRLTTMQLRYPRFIHAEELTHRIISTVAGEITVLTVPDGVMYDRDLSRNASSSRAIPVERLIDDVVRDTAMPLHWGKNQAGMQARVELDEPSRSEAMAIWIQARDAAAEKAREMIEIGAHKQIVNRLLEPFAHINVLVTATQWSNFFALRDHPDAQPEIRVLAQAMKAAMEASTPKLLEPGEWHLPYVDASDEEACLALATQGKIAIDDPVKSDLAAKLERRSALNMLIALSVARCASVSYKTVDGKPMTIEKALDLHQKLLGSNPIHASPAEHQATPDQRVTDHPNSPWERPELHGNLTGWVQYRKLLPNECL